MRNRIQKKYNNNPDLNKLAKYKKLRNEIVNDIQKAKRKFEFNLADKIKSDSKAFYAYVRSKRISKDRIGPLKDAAGRIMADNAEI